LLATRSLLVVDSIIYQKDKAKTLPFVLLLLSILYCTFAAAAAVVV
jgi:hypothetical protein